MSKIIIYTKANCPYCNWAKQLLEQKNVQYTEIRIDIDENNLQKMLEISQGKRSVPQVIINNKLIGGFEELSEMEKSNQLDSLLKKNEE